MLRCFMGRELGDSPGVLARAETTRRVFCLDLSRQHDVQKIHTAPINTLHTDPVEGRYLLSGGGDGVIVIHDLYNHNGYPQCTYPSICTVGRSNKFRHKFAVETVRWYPLDTGMFISSGMDKLLKVWDTNTLVTADEYAFNGVVYCHDLSEVATQHSLIAACSASSKVKLIDIKSGSATHTLKGHRQAVICVKWSPIDEFQLASGSEDSKVMIWDVRSAKGSLMILDQHNGDTSAGPNSVSTAHNGHVNGMCYTSDGLHLVTFGTDEHVRLWSTASGKNSLVNFGKVDNDSRKCMELAVTSGTSPAMLFVPSYGDINMFDLYSGRRLNVLRGHYSQVNSCLYHPHYQDLYSAANDRNILIWTPETSTITAYEQHLLEATKAKEPGGATKFVTRIAATADTWSDDD